MSISISILVGMGPIIFIIRSYHELLFFSGPAFADDFLALGCPLGGLLWGGSIGLRSTTMGIERSSGNRTLTDLEVLSVLVAPLDAESDLDGTWLCCRMSLFLLPSYLELRTRATCLA